MVLLHVSQKLCLKFELSFIFIKSIQFSDGYSFIGKIGTREKRKEKAKRKRKKRTLEERRETFN